MKYILLLTLLFTKLLTAMPIEKTIDELLETEQQKVLQISEYDPFKRAKPLLVRKNTKASIPVPKPLELIAVLNKKAFISGHWYEKGDELFQGKIMKISTQSVHIQKGTHVTVLRMKKGVNLLTIRPKEMQ